MVTRKLDGVCCLIDAPNRKVTSKRGKPLYNFEYIFEVQPEMVGIFECFETNWETSVSLVRTQHDGVPVLPHQLFRTMPPESFLYIGTVYDPMETYLEALLRDAIARGDEGLVLWPLLPDGSVNPKKKPYKVKPKITVDIRITKIIEGTGKYVGMLGAFMTDYGKVGTGFNDDQRVELFDEALIGEIIEVEAMEWTKNKKLRHPSFKRMRWDKNTENLER